IDAGNLRNAIAREGSATITVAADKEDALCDLINKLGDAMRFEFRTTEPDATISIKPTQLPQSIIADETTHKLVDALLACAHGVLSMSREIPNFVETSTNLASVKIQGSNIIITTSQRSSVTSAKQAAAQKLEATFRLIGATVEHTGGYPGWTPNPESRILKVAVDTYKQLQHHDPIVRAIHAGLECGLIGEKYPKMDMISYGPTLRGVHAPGERIEIKTVQIFWDLTLAILKALK
ncbi:MAG: cytosol nonspecific dipeptidase, partial [Bacteroidales bacterium]|nr:cytosol nonspecific dipeptidase [Candidatus Colimorpha onthohippi]